MHENSLKELEKISKETGKHKDYVQGGGGNTSIKLDYEWMAVKASGYKLNQITVNDGFAVVNYRKIIEYMENVDLKSGLDYEKYSIEFIRRNVFELNDIKLLRPSVEAGFHALLKKVVIHTHPVYSNIICCCEEGKDLIETILKNKNIEFIWISYIKPGFSLSYSIMNKCKEYKKNNEKNIDVIFMENHGLIVNEDNPEKCLALNRQVNELIINHLKLLKYPEFKIQKIKENFYKSKNDFMLDFIKNNNVDYKFFDKFALYPDQLVYLNEYLGKKIFIENEEIIYKANESDVLTIEESLLAYFYVIDQIKKLKLTIKTMPKKEVNYIKNWEVEKFRRQVSSKK